MTLRDCTRAIQLPWPSVIFHVLLKLWPSTILHAAKYLDNSFIWVISLFQPQLETQKARATCLWYHSRWHLSLLTWNGFHVSHPSPLRMCSFSMTLFKCDTKIGKHFKPHHSIAYTQETTLHYIYSVGKKAKVFLPHAREHKRNDLSQIILGANDSDE